MEVWALVSGSNGSTTDEGLQIADGSFLSTNASGGATNGTLKTGLVSPFNASGSTLGSQTDLDGDGDLDVGSNDDSSATGFFFTRSSTLKTGTQFKIGNLSFTVTSLKSTSGSTNINYRIRNWVSGALWKEDGNNILKNALSGTYVAGSPVVIKTTNGGTPDSGAISGKVWNDNDGDGILDSGESGKSGVQVFLDSDKDGNFDSGEPGKTTDSSGNYSFTGLSVGTHRVRIVTPGGFAITQPSIGYFDVSLNNTTSSGKNFGLKTTTAGGGSITGRVFNDGNKDGTYDSGESLLANRKIYIDGNSNGKYDSGEKTALSNASGIYSFTGLAAGTYRVGRADLPSGYYISTVAGGIYTVNLSSGEIASGIDFGAVLGKPPSGSTGSISGRIFNDGNNDGTYDSGESLLSARKVFIDANNNGRFDSGEKSVLSNSSGVYTFSSLAAGTYIIRRDNMPGGYIITTPLVNVSLSSGEVVTNQDIGAALAGSGGGGTGSISGRVFNDGNKDGTYDSGESLLSARKIYIDSNNNNKLDSGEKSVYSNSSGVYTFTGLAAGNYIVRRSGLPSGYYITTPLINVSLSGGQILTNRDIGAALVIGGVTPTGNGGSITGRLFNDGNQDGNYDSGESLLSARKIYIDANNNGNFDSGEKYDYTDSAGVYLFDALADGTYHVRRADMPSGYRYTTPDVIAILSNGTDVTGRDIGVART
jgi:hypothetical protein